MGLEGLQDLVLGDSQSLAGRGPEQPDLLSMTEQGGGAETSTHLSQPQLFSHSVKDECTLDV